MSPKQLFYICLLLLAWFWAAILFVVWWAVWG